MGNRLLTIAVAAGVLMAGQGALWGQFGPKDGGDLPPADLERVQAGQAAPDFTLADSEGDPVTLSKLRGKNVVLVFYRGYW